MYLMRALWRIDGVYVEVAWRSVSVGSTSCNWMTTVEKWTDWPVHNVCSDGAAPWCGGMAALFVCRLVYRIFSAANAPVDLRTTNYCLLIPFVSDTERLDGAFVLCLWWTLEKSVSRKHSGHPSVQWCVDCRLVAVFHTHAVCTSCVITAAGELMGFCARYFLLVSRVHFVTK